MKTTLFFIVFFFYSITLLNAQELPAVNPAQHKKAGTSKNEKQERVLKTTEFRYDFVKGDSLPTDFFIKKDERVNFRITNINKALYNISINNANKSLYGEKPAIFNFLSDIKLPVLDDQKADSAADDKAYKLPKVAKAYALSKEFEELSEKYYQQRDAYIGLLETFPETFKKLKKIDMHYKALTGLLADDCHTFKDILTSKISTSKSLVTSFDPSFSSIDEIEIGLKLKSSTVSLFEELNEDYDEIIKAGDELKVLQLRYLEKIDLELAKTEVKKNAKLFSQLQADKKEILLKSGLLDAALAQIKISKTKIDAFDQADFSGNFKKVYDKINAANWIYVSPTYKASKDVMEVKFSIEPKEQLVCAGNYPAFNTEINGHVTGFKINFSTGFFLLQGKKIFDQSYRAEAVVGDSVNNLLVENENKSRIVPAVGALMHFYHEGKTNFNFGGTFGLSVNNETNLAYHGGVSFLFGKQQRIILSMGASLVKVKLISDAYSVGGKIPKAVTTIPTSSYHKWGTFISFTYNLSN